MKRIAATILVICACGTIAFYTGNTRAASEQAKHFSAFPGTYPYWIARILAPLGVADAQAAIGFAMLSEDFPDVEKNPCKGANYLLLAAQQHQLFAETQLLGLYHITGTDKQDVKMLQKSFLWYLHFQSHFPNDKDESKAVVAMLKLTPEQETAIREAFKTWDPQKEPPSDPASCPSPNTSASGSE